MGGGGHEDGGDGKRSELHSKGDGTYHTVTSDGEHMDHPTIHHATAHLAHHHEGGAHMHIHHDGSKMSSSHVAEDGEVQGPHDHANIEALKEHLGKFFGEEENEGAGGGYGGHGEESGDMTGLGE